MATSQDANSNHGTVDKDSCSPKTSTAAVLLPSTSVNDTTIAISTHNNDSNKINNNSNKSQYYDESKKIFYPLTGIRPVTPGYMEIANQTPVKLDTPKKLLVILDLNGTLFYSNDKHRKHSYIKRPYFTELLRYLYANCRVMIWSSATRQRITNMISSGGFIGLDKIDRVWNREHLRLHNSDYNRKVLTLKDLEFIWTEIDMERSKAKPDQLAVGGQYEFRYDQTNTVLIDDSPHKTQLQPYNSMIVPDFDATRQQSGDDQELLKVIHYLKELMLQDNVSAYVRTNPFDTNNKYYLSDQFRDELATVTLPLKNKLKKDKKREAKRAATAGATSQMRNIEKIETRNIQTSSEETQHEDSRVRKKSKIS
ncbi:hypothetical protein FBU30_001795 [Linnemannia zychae]|nr:hypothetical protein FBU30_001795 [Linnemannia zychae]